MTKPKPPVPRKKTAQSSLDGGNLDRGNMGAQMQRYAQTSGTAAGLGVRMVAEKFLGIKIERGQHAGQLKDQLGKLKGPLMKVAQLLATIPEALPPEYADALRQLQSNAPPMGWLFVRRRMAAELGADWQQHFLTFDQQATAAASLGQVHKATLRDGTVVACKLQYPDMRAVMQADLGQLKMMMALFEQYDKAIGTKDIHAELAARLFEELDYEREGKMLRLYGSMLAAEPHVHVPHYYPDYSTDRLLCMQWLDGQKLLDYKDAAQEVRNQLAYNLFRAWYVPFYNFGIIHGDPHLGNYSVRDDYGINLLDFGCTRIFPASFVGGVIDLYHALERNDVALAVHAYEVWGFKNLSHETIAVLNTWARFLYGPLLDDTARPIGVVQKGQVYGQETAAKVHAELRRIGGVTVPREFVFMDRAALGLGSVFIHLQANHNWHRLFHDMIDGFNAPQLAAHQQSALQAVGLSQE